MFDVLSESQGISSRAIAERIGSDFYRVGHALVYLRNHGLARHDGSRHAKHKSWYRVGSEFTLMGSGSAEGSKANLLLGRQKHLPRQFDGRWRKLVVMPKTPPRIGSLAEMLGA